ncbi:competence protein [Bifidobacterium sp. DSM 109957]|uniref:Competence protein n=2 Tax=Bifidobacterium oedipodis TaxID=2675322 RepID=A0A7Y0EQ51_9BIFI|nr:competence protein [Bifidobacterium sp. DSM 109957]
MLPVALTAWAASLATHYGFAWMVSDMTGDGSVTPVLRAWPIPSAHPILLIGMTITVLLLAVLVVAAVLKRRWAVMLAACVAMALVASIASITANALLWIDPATVQARQGKAVSTVTLMLSAPAVAADQRDYDCQADARLTGLQHDGETLRSAALARIYASGEECTQLVNGGGYRMTGVLQQAEYGKLPLWLLVEEGNESARIRAAPVPLAVVHHMQQTFFAVTEQLPDQGRVLVPGLTLGVLGQDYVGGAADMNPVNDTYAQRLEDCFRRSGIMHLMAVSGGHFALLSELVRRACAWLLIDRRITAVAMAMALVGLATAMFPSDSVMRALIMGLMSAACLMLGRRAQALSALCWTVIGVLIIQPRMACSFGFALSAAAVLGIVLFARPLSELLGKVMPHPLAEGMAMTMAAQMFTLPIQILMEPQLPLLSIPANLIVAPFVGFSTITGLMALCCAWCLPALAGILAGTAALGTLVMERVALWLGNGSMAMLPWAEGVWGALLMLAAELAVAWALRGAMRRVRRFNLVDEDLPGERFGSSWRVRLNLWWQGTIRLVNPCPAMRGD